MRACRTFYWTLCHFSYFIHTVFKSAWSHSGLRLIHVTFPTALETVCQTDWVRHFTIVEINLISLNFPSWISIHRAKNHISPGEPYFATFFYNCFQCFGHFFEADSKIKFLEFITIKERTSVSRKDEEITGDWSKYVVKYGHPAKYGCLLYNAESRKYQML